MPAPALPIIAAAGAAAYYIFKPKTPQRDDYQVTTVTGAGGVPVKVATPVPSAVTAAQATTVPHSAPSPAGTSKGVVQTIVPGQGAVYAPPAAMTQTAPGKVQLAPIVITPTGASSVAMSSTLDVQRAINTLGHVPPLKEDGVLGPMTIAAVKAFQGQSNLAVDGNAGPATKSALSVALTALASGGSGAPAGAAADAAHSDGTLDTSPALTMTNLGVQRALNVLGASPHLAEDGQIGPKSVAAIKSFQLSHGLVSDGIAGPKTKVALYTAMSQAAGGGPVAVSGEHGAYEMGAWG